MHLLLYTNATTSLAQRKQCSEEAIAIEIRQTEADRIAQSIQIFIQSNFWLAGPPRYMDSDGDYVLLDSHESYKAAVCDILSASESAMVLLIDGSYKYESTATTGTACTSAISTTTNESAAAPKERTQVLSAELLDSLMAKIREEIRVEVKRELDARICCCHVTSSEACKLPPPCYHRSADEKTKSFDDRNASDGRETAYGDENNIQEGQSWSNNVELYAVFAAPSGVQEAKVAAKEGQIEAVTPLITTLADIGQFSDSFISSEFRRSTTVASVGATKVAEDFVRAEKQISLSSPHLGNKSDVGTERHYSGEVHEHDGCMNSAGAEKVDAEKSDSADSVAPQNSNGSVRTSQSTVVNAERKKSGLEALNESVMSSAEKCSQFLNGSSHCSSKTSENDPAKDQSDYEITGSVYAMDNVDCLTVSQLSEVLVDSNDHRYSCDTMSFVCLHSDCRYAVLSYDEMQTHDRSHIIVRPGLGMHLEDVVSLCQQILSGGRAATAQLSPPVFARPNRLLPRNVAMGAEIEHEGEVALMTEIDENKGTFWKQWTIRNSGSVKWKNVTLELITHTPNLEPFFCSISLPNSLNVGRSLDAVVWMN
ncbi:unnamed protein product, partial [Toxocara canis]|uniref:C2H2-type domain-containing protein n=1 Tax=Toxocara canis TaxID=6265 RepID=A0A183VEE6_TOXCA